eukprot:TRINITY_DN6551_c0_g4_i1.p1 TRINITY_DN6551_c0_g4~~TRINITY_DN6551_c0_g4_i1.p1  ORF type:complete len:1060 (+),score=310.50 TRINITY_DN6551_c0_g4_i1:193-3372(+)
MAPGDAPPPLRPVLSGFYVGQKVRAKGRLKGDQGQVVERDAVGEVTAIPGPGRRLIAGAVAEVRISGVTFDASDQMIEALGGTRGAGSPRGRRHGGEERRADPTVPPGHADFGKTYTQRQFGEFYGDAAADLWRTAGAADAERRPDPTVEPGQPGYGKKYSREQFESYYGGAAGKMWRSAAAGPQQEERRADPTVLDGEKGSGKTYTKRQFVSFYGAEAGARLWKVAGGEEAATRSMTRRLRRQGQREAEQKQGQSMRDLPKYVNVTVKIKREEGQAVGWSRDTSSCVIVDVEAGSPAAAAGVVAGVKIVSVSGEAVKTGDDIAAAIAKAGAEFEVVLRKATPRQGTFGYPVARRSDFKEELHGRTVADPYRWMEDNDTPEVQGFAQAQSDLAEAYLNSIPYRSRVRARMSAQIDYARMSVPRKHGGRYHYSYNTGLQDQSVLYFKKNIHDEEEKPTVFCDPNKLSTDGKVAIGVSSFSVSGRYWAAGVSVKGSDWMHATFKDCETLEDLPDRLEWLKHSSLCWVGDVGVFYCRNDPPEGMTKMSDAVGTGTEQTLNQKVMFHKLGTPQEEDTLLCESTKPEEMFGVQATDDNRYITISVCESCGARNKLWYIDLKGKDPAKITAKDIVKLLDEYEYECEVIDNDGESFFLQTTQGAANQRVMKIDLSTFSAERGLKECWREVIPEGKNPLTWVATSAPGILYTCYMEDVKDVLYWSTFAEPDKKTRIELDCGSVASFSAQRDSTEVFLAFTGFTAPRCIYLLNAEKLSEGMKLHWQPKIAGYDPSKFETHQVFFKSKDGTRVPMFMVHKKGLRRNGDNLTVLYVYGGFRISLSPWFSTIRLSLLDNFNGVFCVVNARGGLEYGEQWHDDGILGKKQNTIDDVIGAAKWLRKNMITSPEKLAIQGGSNGGMVVAATANQAPQLFGAVVAQVGVMDMLRFHKFTVGHMWASDFGSPDDKESFENIIKYSPLHCISPRKQYPSVLCITGDHDDRVVPLHTYKYIAELQHKCGRQANPFLARVQIGAGHGAGKPMHLTIAEEADTLCFVAHRCGGRYREQKK